MAGNKSLSVAAKAKEDEFYTQLTDIEKELKHYRNHFKDKIILCNCDDPRSSNFWRYFAINFEFLGIKKLIATHYDEEKPTYKIELSNDISGDGHVDENDVVETKFTQNGDFRSPECIEILKEADIVVTNPPFSLFRDYLAQLIQYEKKFIIIGSQNNVTYKDVFPLLMHNKIWLGYHAGDMSFMVPEYYEPRSTRYWVDENGQKWRSMGNITWFTNLDIEKRHEDIVLYKKYTPEEYPKYDNYEAIEVKKVSEIPCNYYGIMGVPITFMNKYNPDQFEILGITLGNTVDYPMTNIYENAIQHNKNGTTQGGSKVNTRAAILTKDMPLNTVYYTADNANGYLLSIYPRILIRRK